MRIAYSDEEDFPGQFALYRANTDKQLDGRQGQAVLRELEAALLALPRKRLARKQIAKDGDVCAVGALIWLKHTKAGRDPDAAIKQLEDEYYDPARDSEYFHDDYTDNIAVHEGVAPALVAWRLVELNDVLLEDCTPEERYEQVLSWVRNRIKETP